MCMSLVVHLYLVLLDGCKQTKMQRAYTIYIYILGRRLNIFTREYLRIIQINGLFF
jgi:hypothetical protein